jgi:hypothetical protein
MVWILIGIIYLLFDGVRLCLWTAATNGPIVHPPDDIWVWSSGGMILMGKTEEFGENPVPVPLCPPQIPHGLTWVRTWASTVGGRWLTIWAMARPSLLHWDTDFMNNKGYSVATMTEPSNWPWLSTVIATLTTHSLSSHLIRHNMTSDVDTTSLNNLSIIK